MDDLQCFNSITEPFLCRDINIIDNLLKNCYYEKSLPWVKMTNSVSKLPLYPTGIGGEFIQVHHLEFKTHGDLQWFSFYYRTTLKLSQNKNFFRPQNGGQK